MSGRKKPRQLSSYIRKLLAIIDKYIEISGDKCPDLYAVAKWAKDNKEFEIPAVDIVRIMARALAGACRQDFYIDENGEPVRRRHAVKEDRNGEQLTLWPKMEDMSPQQMRVSLQSRRNGTLQDALQSERDRRYFNKKFNPGDDIEVDWNLTPDIEEHFMPPDYDDSPPEE